MKKRKILCAILASVMLLSVSACKPDDNPNDNKNQYTQFEGMDEVLYAHTRLNNADMSFNFNMSSRQTVNGVSLLSVAPFEKEYNLSDMEYVKQESYFESQIDSLNTLKNKAESVVDTVTSFVTVFDKVVNFESTKYLLSFDNEKNYIYCMKLVEYGDSAFNEIEEIELYYDEDGDEVVVYSWTYENTTEMVKYIPNKYYFYSSKQGDMYQVSLARKIGENWKGLRFHAHKNNPYLTHEGTYDYANGMLYIEFLVEYNNNFYIYRDRMIALRNGVETGSQVDASLDDEYAMKRYVLETEFGFIDMFDDKIGTLGVNIGALNGIKKVHLSFDRPEELENAPDYIHYYFYDENDYLEFENDVVLRTFEHWTDPQYPGVDVQLDAGEGYLYELELKGHEPLRFVVSGDSIEEQLGNFAKFMTANGLTFDSVFGGNPIEDLIIIEKSNNENRHQLFEKELGIAYDAQGTAQILHNYINILSDKHQEHRSNPFEGYDIINADEMEEMSDTLQLFTIESTQRANISNVGINFSNISFSITPSIILFENKEYTILVTTNAGEILGTFNTVIYNGESMTFNGTIVNLPLISCQYLNLTFAKKDNGRYIPLSNMLKININSFEEFTIEGEETFNYKYENGITVEKIIEEDSNNVE